jgi:hypothetical protein
LPSVYCPAIHTYETIFRRVQEFMSEVSKAPHGGARPGAGRPKGHKNKKTLQRELMANQAIDDVLAKLSPDDIEKLLPLDVMILAMSTMLKAGNLLAAAAVAEKAAPYCHSKLASAEILRPLPEDLEPDPIPTPDQPGPENPLL